MNRFLILLLISLILPLQAQARRATYPVKPHIHQYAALTLYDYIQQLCPKNCVDSEKIKEITTHTTASTGIDRKIILAIIAIESSFNTKARNGVNVGLNQVNLYYHHKSFKNTNVYDPEKNIAIGTEIFYQCMVKHHHNLNQSLRCYNGYGLGDSQYVSKFHRAYQDIKTLVDLSLDT